MTDAAGAATAAPDDAPKKKDDEEKPGFCFTDPGCRTDLRAGALLVLAAVFLWLWWGPANSTKLYLIGAPLLLWGVPMQALQTRRGRPGYPWKLGLALAIGGLVMIPDLRWQQWWDHVRGVWHVQTVAPLLAAAGVWILLWWPIARVGAKPESATWR